MVVPTAFKNQWHIAEEDQFDNGVDSGMSNFSDTSLQSPDEKTVESAIAEAIPFLEEQLAIRLDPSYEITSNVTSRPDGSITIRLKVNKGGPGQLPRYNRRKPSTVATPALPTFTTTPDGIITDENYKRHADTKQMLSERTQNRIQRYLQEESKSFAALSENPDAAAWRLFRNVFDAISECHHHQEGIIYETQEQINKRLEENNLPLINYKLEDFLPQNVINFVHECRDNFWQTTDKQHTKAQWQKKFDQVLAFWMTASKFEKIPDSTSNSD